PEAGFSGCREGVSTTSAGSWNGRPLSRETGRGPVSMGDDRAGEAAAERPARAHASHPEGTNGAAAEQEPEGAASALRSISSRVQRRSAARGAGAGDTRVGLRPVGTARSANAACDLPEALRDAKGRE